MDLSRAVCWRRNIQRKAVWITSFFVLHSLCIMSCDRSMPKKRISGAHTKFLHTFTNCTGLNVPLLVPELGWLKTSSYIMTLTFWRLVFLETKGLLKTIRQLVTFVALGTVNYCSTKTFADSHKITGFSLLNWSRSYVTTEKNET